MNRHRLVIMVVVAVALAGGIAGWLLSQPSPFEHPSVGVQVVHASPGTQGCAACHADVIAYTTCSDTGCHDPLAPPYVITPTTMTITFLHHDEASQPGGVTCQDCHAGVANDARYITVPTASHTGICGTCHPRTHSTPP